MNLINKDLTLLFNRDIEMLPYDDTLEIIENDYQSFKEQLFTSANNNISILPVHPGFEKHPYKGLLENDFASKYIVGTFPPISYFIDILNNEGCEIENLQQPNYPYQFISRPKVPFFHGNISGLWKVLLPVDEFVKFDNLQISNRNEAKEYLLKWLNENNIYYDDIIAYTQRSLSKLPSGNSGYSYEDINLKNIYPDIRLIQKILTNKNLNIISFTNGATFRSGQNGGLGLYTQMSKQGFVKTGNSDALSLFLNTCQTMGLQIEMRCQPFFDWTKLYMLTECQKRTKLIFELKFTKTASCFFEGLNNFENKIFTVITPFSPAAHGNIELHPIILSFRTKYGQLSIEQILKIVYEKFRSGSHEELYEHNINQ